jgi:transposase-like protein
MAIQEEALPTNPTEGDLGSRLRINDIRRDGSTQTRRWLDASVVRRYCALLKQGANFPPVRVWFDGINYWLVDGFHRVAAAESAGFKYVTAEILHGPLEAAIWDSFSANSRHGLPRKRSDLVAIIGRAIKHTQAASMSNVDIAKHLGVTETTIRRWRRRLSSTYVEDTVRQVTRKGTAYSLRTANIGGSANSRHVTARSLTELNSELSAMCGLCSVRVKPLLIAIRAWLFEGAQASELVTNLDALLSANPSDRTD